MNSRRWPTLVMVLLLALVAAPVSWGQTQIVSQVIGSGAVASTSGSILMAGTIGQTIIGRSTSSSHVGALGFWYTYPRQGTTGVREEYSRVVGATASLTVAPNPAVEQAVVTVSLPVAGQVQLKVYNALGQEQMTLIDDRREAGTITVRVPASELGSGDYAVVLTANGMRSSTPLRVVR